MAGNCYTRPLIPPDLPLNHSDVNSYNSQEYVMKNDLEFAQACQIYWLLFAITSYRESDVNQSYWDTPKFDPPFSPLGWYVIYSTFS